MPWAVGVGYAQRSDGSLRQVHFPVNPVTGHVYAAGSPWVLRFKCAAILVFSPALIVGKAARDALALLVRCFGAMIGFTTWAETRREGVKLLRTIPLIFVIPAAGFIGLFDPKTGGEMVADWMRWGNCQDTVGQYWQEWQPTGALLRTNVWIPICMQPIDNLASPITHHGDPKPLEDLFTQRVLQNVEVGSTPGARNLADGLVERLGHMGTLPPLSGDALRGRVYQSRETHELMIRLVYRALQPQAEWMAIPHSSGHGRRAWYPALHEPQQPSQTEEQLVAALLPKIPANTGASFRAFCPQVLTQLRAQNVNPSLSTDQLYERVEASPVTMAAMTRLFFRALPPAYIHQAQLNDLATHY
jgi:hypothetical protein